MSCLSWLQGTNCLARPGETFLKVLIARDESSFVASGPSTYRSAMWNDRLKAAHAFCHACVCARQVVYSGGTPGYTLGPLGELRRKSTAFFPCSRSSRLFMAYAWSATPRGKSYMRP